MHLEWKNQENKSIINVITISGDDNMDKILKSTKASFILTTILSIGFGIVLLVEPKITTTAISYALGVILMICAIFHAGLYFKIKNKHSLAVLNILVSIITGVIGIYIISNPSSVTNIIPFILGLLLMIGGILNIKLAIELKRIYYKYWWIAMLLGVINFGLSLLIVYYPFKTTKSYSLINSLSFIYNGIATIWILSRLMKASKEIKESLNTINKAYIDEKL